MNTTEGLAFRNFALKKSKRIKYREGIKPSTSNDDKYKIRTIRQFRYGLEGGKHLIRLIFSKILVSDDFCYFSSGKVNKEKIITSFLRSPSRSSSRSSSEVEMKSR